MKYKQNFLIQCDEKCMYRSGEECTLTLEKFKKHEADNTTRQMPCTGHPRSYSYDVVERQLWKERTTPCEPKQMELELDGAAESAQNAAEMPEITTEIPEITTEIPENVTEMSENDTETTGNTATVETFSLPEAKETLTGEVIPPYATYAEYKQELDREVRQEVEGYVRIGYLLKIARDTSILAESGYANLYDFAQAEYNIDKSRVSRYMAINDRFAENGYSMELKDEYKGYGVAKLSMMLTLPDEINEELSPEMTKSEIQDIRDEVAEEQKITPMEHMLDGETETTAQGETLLQKVLLQLFESKPELYVEVNKDSMGLILETDRVMQALAPAGEMIYSVRIRGLGRYLLSIKDYEKYVTITNERTGEKDHCEWSEVIAELNDMYISDQTPEQNWQTLFGREFPKDAEVAPVQPDRKVVKVNETPKPAKISKKPQEPAKALKREPEQKPVQQSVEEIIKDWERRMSEPKQETLHEIDKEIPEPEPVEEPVQVPEHVEQASEDTQEQQLPGQANIEDYPEYMPETVKISEGEFNKRGKQYRNAYASNVACAEMAMDDGNWEEARRNLQSAISIIDDLEALYKMEIEDEEE